MNISIVRILDILKDYTDSQHPMKQDEIIEKMYSIYGIEIERKSVGRNINTLRELGYNIVSTREGSYLGNREFSDAELRLLIDGVLASSNISLEQSKTLIGKIEKLSNKYFNTNIKHIHSINDWNKTKNDQLFKNIELIDEAIERGKQISFDYNKYGIDHKLHKSSEHIASPYQLILHNQRYYVMMHSEKHKQIRFLRMDRITNMKILVEPATNIRRIPGYEAGINYKDISGARPYMYSDLPERITFRATEGIVDQVIDWFGDNVRITTDNSCEGFVKCDILASPNAMKYWAIQYAESVEVIFPKSLRTEIGEVLKNSAEKYGKS